GGGNAQLGLCAGVELTPDDQLTSHKFGAFVHTWQTVVSGAPASIKKLRVNALTVVPDPQTKAPLLIADFHFDPPRVCVAECIAHRLAGNPIDFVPEDWSKIPRCALHLHTKVGTIIVGLMCSEFFSEHADRRVNVAGNKRGGAQALYCVPALGDGLSGLLDDGLQRL